MEHNVRLIAMFFLICRVVSCDVGYHIAANGTDESLQE